MAVITEEQVEKTQEFYRKACEEYLCIFAQGYCGFKPSNQAEWEIRRGELPVCGRGRNTLLNAAQNHVCHSGLVMAIDSQTGHHATVGPVTISPKGAKFQENTKVIVSADPPNPNSDYYIKFQVDPNNRQLSFVEK